MRKSLQHANLWPGRQACLRRVTAVAFGLLLTGFAGNSAAQQVEEPPLQIVFEEYQPFFHQEEDGTVSGLYGTPAAEVFNHAGIDFQWQRVSFNRLIRMLQQDRRPACAVGYGHVEERSKYARISDMFVKGSPIVLVARPDVAPRLREHGTLKMIVADPTVKGAFVSTPESRSLFDHVPEALERNLLVNVEDAQLFDMVGTGRADYALLNRDTANFLNAERGGDLEIVMLDDLTKTTDRYIMCSRAVSEHIMDRINAGIAALHAKEGSD